MTNIYSYVIMNMEYYIIGGDYMNETKVIIIKEEKAKDFFSQKPNYEKIKEIRRTANKYAHNATWIEGRKSRKAL